MIFHTRQSCIFEISTCSLINVDPLSLNIFIPFNEVVNHISYTLGGAFTVAVRGSPRHSSGRVEDIQEVAISKGEQELINKVNTVIGRPI